MNLNSRLRSLERATAITGPQACGTCGRGPGNKPLRDANNLRVISGREDEPAYDGPEVCPECGERLVLRIEFDRGEG